MSHSLKDADRSTHFKIVAVALVSAIVLVVVGLMARTDHSGTSTAQMEPNGPVLKVGKSKTVTTTQDGSAIR
jgi:hypothetical protein